MRACAKVGIIAMIDEAPGYQEVRAKNALQIKLQALSPTKYRNGPECFPMNFWFELRDF
jgi:hypothetical protein